VILAALLIVASAQIPLCYHERCQGLDQDCHFVDTVNFVRYDCKGGLNCYVGGDGTGNGTCLGEHKLTEQCTDNGICVNSNYDIECYSGTCLYPAALGPTESCSAADSTKYAAGNPCGGSSTCSGTCSGGGIASGSVCDDAPVGSTQTCASGLYCAYGKGNNGTNVCQARLDVGAPCTSTAVCKWNLICTSRGPATGNFTCQAPFAQGSGSGCFSIIDCNANLYCDATNHQCTTATTGTECTMSDANVPSGTCPNVNYECKCNSGTAGDTKGKCVIDLIPQSTINDVTSYFSCMNSNCLYDVRGTGVAHTNFLVEYTPDTCAAKKCASQFNNVRTYANGLGVTGGCGGGSPATTVSVVAFLVLAMAAITLMF